MRLDAERDSLAEVNRESVSRLQAELEAVRLDLTRRLHEEQATVAKLREELRSTTLEASRVHDLRLRERTEAEAGAQRAAEVQRAAIARMESQMAASSSQAALDLERSRKELADERAITQEIVTEAKQEAAAAMAQTLEAREDAMRWQRSMTPHK